MTETRTIPFDWALFFYWLMATAMGLLVGWLLLPAVALLAGGAGAILMQWLVLQHRIPKAWRWIPISAAGWVGGVLVSIMAVPSGFGVVSGAVIGLCTGISQWTLLRREVHWAGWWVAVSCLAWAIGLASGLDLLPRAVLAGTVAGTVTGVALELLLRTLKTQEIATQERID